MRKEEKTQVDTLSYNVGVLANTTATLCQHGSLGWKRVNWEVGTDVYSLLYTK